MTPRSAPERRQRKLEPSRYVDTTADALRDTLISPNESDVNLEAANVVDGLYAIARAIRQLAEAVSKMKGGA